MHRRTRWIMSAWFVLILAGFTGVRAADDCGEDAACLRQLHDSHAVKNVKTLRSYQALPFDRRVVVAPAKLLDYLNIDNRLNGFPNQPRYTRPDPQFLDDIQSALKELPEAVKNLVDSRLMGIFLVQDLGGTGYTDYVYDDHQVAAGAFIVLDVDVLTRVANDWATWKENTPFNASSGFALEAIVENPAEDTRKQALQYILLHELGHVASVGRHIHPPWDGWDCATDPPGNYPFFEESWVLSGEPDCKVVSRFDDSGFTFRKDLVYYFGARLALSDSPAVYAQLEQTNFPTLYASTFPGDDFAEAFVTYVHTRLMARPFEIRIRHDGAPETRFTGCWGEPRCAGKLKLMEELFLESSNG